MSPCRSPGAGARLWNSASETSAAAPPPTPLNSATICGIAVIFTRARGDRAEARRRSTIPTRDLPVAARSRPAANVTTIATSIPTAPIWLPRRACAGYERKRSARMKADDRDQVEQVRDVAAHAPSSVVASRLGSRFLNISSIRSVTTKPPTTFADASTTATNPTTVVQRVLVVDAGDEHRADDHDPVDRVRARHQRRVQQRRHLRDHLEAEEDREHEDRQLEDEQALWLIESCPFRTVDAPQRLMLCTALRDARAGRDLVVPVERELAARARGARAARRRCASRAGSRGTASSPAGSSGRRS